MASLTLIWEKIKAEERTIYWVGMIIVIGLLGFGLGRLSKIEASKTPVIIEQATSNNYVAGAGERVLPVLAEEVNATSSTGQVVASKKGTKYHYPWCAGAQAINPANKISFPSIAAARAAGYQPAANCKGLR